MTTFYTLLSWLLVSGYWLLIAGVTLRILMKRRTVTSSMAWLLVIYILPLLGVVAYFSFGELYLGKRRAKRARAMWPSTAIGINELKRFRSIFSKEYSSHARPLFQLCENRQGIAAVKGNLLHLFSKTDETFLTMIRDIHLARECIDIVFYIWQPGGRVDTVSEALIAAAQRGVHCRLILDSAGSVVFFRSHWPKIMRNAGIDIVEALKVRLVRVFLRRMDLRQHRKFILIDQRVAYTGSMNMADPRYFKQSAGVGQWIDLMLRLEGPAVAIMSIIFSHDWEMETGIRILPSFKSETLPCAQQKNHAIQIISSGPGFPDDMLHQALLTAVWSARKQLTMTTPYFSPSEDLLHAICTAALRGVAVSLFIPLRNDSLLVDWASRAFFTELLEAGVKIYQFNSGLLHTKSVLVDGQLSLIGTANLDMRSLWLNFEITVVIDEKELGQTLQKIHRNYIQQSSKVDADIWSARPYWKRIVERLFYFLSPLL